MKLRLSVASVAGTPEIISKENDSITAERIDSVKD
jgi:hypothetical protein